MNQLKFKNDGQVLLLLPKEWVKELDILARANFVTRLALIRKYLRKAMDDHLSQLDHISKIQEKNDRVRRNVEHYLDENEINPRPAREEYNSF